jgi:hypothetical protein
MFYVINQIFVSGIILIIWEHFPAISANFFSPSSVSKSELAKWSGTSYYYLDTGEGNPF